MRGLGRMCRDFRHFSRQLSNTYDTQRVSTRLRSMLFAEADRSVIWTFKRLGFYEPIGKGHASDLDGVGAWRTTSSERENPAQEQSARAQVP
jgi:hypothetical protein